MEQGKVPQHIFALEAFRLSNRANKVGGKRLREQ